MLHSEETVVDVLHPWPSSELHHELHRCSTGSDSARSREWLPGRCEVVMVELLRLDELAGLPCFPFEVG